jgi:uncharacterized protein (DUF983 family)
MLEKVKKFGIIIVMAILVAAFCFSIADVIVQRPDYNQVCPSVEKPIPYQNKDQACTAIKEPSEDEIMKCSEQKGFIEYKYNSVGCPTSFSCNTCSAKYEEVTKDYDLMVFAIVSILGVISIIAGMYVTSKNEVVEWVFSGILIGGIAAIFIATMSYFHQMSRFIKPVVLLVEMGLIIWVAVRTTKNITKKYVK